MAGTESRVLVIVERIIDDSSRDAYIATLRSRRAEAATERAQFWAFEHAQRRGRFVEFTESTDAVRAAQLAGVTPGDVWHAVEVS